MAENEKNMTAETEAADEKPRKRSAALDMDALKAELLAELRKEMEADAEAAAAEKSEDDKNAEAFLNELVTVQLFKDGRDYKDDLTVHLNGKNIAIKRGVPVQIPRKYALIIEQHERQDVKAAEYAAAMQRDYQDQVRQFSI